MILCMASVCLLALPAAAAGTQFAVSASATQVLPGDELTFTVTASGDAPCTSFTLVPVFDNAKFELVRGACTVTGAVTADFDNISFVIGYGEPTAPAGAIATFTLKAKEDAASGDTTVTVEAAARNVDAEVECAVTAATVRVACSHVYDNDCDSSCNLCGAERTVEHAWNEGQETVAPDCTTEGVMTYTCTKCGVTKTEPIPVRHVYDNRCDPDCNLCGAVREPEHDWDNGTVTLEPGCETEGSITYTCKTEGCGATRTEILPPAHKYEGDWQTDEEGHWLVCSCGAVSPKEAHVNGEAWQSDGDYHWHTCEECGYRNKQEHTPGPEATEYTNQVCTTCNKVLQWAWHTCTWSEEWFRDDRGHGHQCTACGRVSPVEKHVYDNDCDPDCSVCGYTRIPQHIYDNHWTSNASGHWHACTLCGEGLEIEAHIPGPEATATTPQLCLICGYEIKPSTTHVHKFQGEWHSDADGHWKECTCGMADSKQDHRWDEGVITRAPTSSVVGRKTYTCLDCGEKRTESIDSIPGGPNSTNGQSVEKPGFPWWVVIVIVAVPVLIGGLYIIKGVTDGKKQEDEYNE